MRAALGAFLAGHGRWRVAGAVLFGVVQRQALLHRVLHAARQDVLDGIGHSGHFGVVPQRHARAVGLLVGAQAHRAAVPGHFAHVGQRALQETAARGQRQQAHAGGDPLLRLAVLPHGHEELDGAVHRALAHAGGHGQEGDDEVQALVAVLRPVLDLLGHGREGALGAALDHGAHRVDGLALLLACRGWCCGRRGRGRRRCGFEHGTQDGVGPVGGQALEARLPGLQVQVLEVFVRVVGRHVDGLGDRGVHKRLHRLHHRHVVGRRHLQRRDEVRGQVLHVAAQVTVQAPGVVFHLVLAAAAIGLALAARVGPGERRLDAIGRVVRKSQAHRAGGRHRQQVAVANAVLADGVLQRGRQAAGEGARSQVAIGIELGKRALFLRQGDGGGVGGVAHALGNARSHGAAVGRVVAQAQHGQGVAHAGEAHANAALGGRLVALLLQRPVGHVQHVVQCAHLGGHHLLEGVEVERGRPVHAERVAHEAREDDGAQVAAAIGRQGLLAAGVGGGDLLAVLQVVVFVDAAQEQDAGLGEVVGRAHDGVPQLARAQRLVDPQPVGALAHARLLAQLAAGLGAVHQLPGGVLHHGLHEFVGHAHRHVEIVPASRGALGGDEVEHVGMVDAQHAHLRATARTGALHGGAGLVEHVDVAARPRGQRARSAHARAARADAREVVAHAAAAAHGFSRLAQGFVDAGIARIVHALDAIAHGLNEAVDERCLDVGARGAHDAAGADGAGLQVREEFGLPLSAAVFGLDRGQGARHARVELLDAGLARLEVFFAQHIQADGLYGGLGRGGGLFAFHGSAFLFTARGGQPIVHF